MKMSKMLASLLLVAAVTGTMSVNAYAHGGHGGGGHGGGRHGRQSTATSYEACNVKDCAQLGIHEHDGSYYDCSNHGEDCAGSGCRR